VVQSEEIHVAKPNYQFEKRQRELEKKRKKAEKAEKKSVPQRAEPETYVAPAPAIQPPSQPTDK
jgi:hypothetical protein